MSDLDGLDAFNALLDRLADTIGELHKLQAQKYEADSLLNRARHDLENQTRESSRLRSDLEKLNLRDKKALPILSELHTAAEAALPHLTNVSGVRERLQKVVKEAGPYCDEIPF